MIYYLLSILCSKNTRVSKISLAHLLSLRLEWKSLVATKIPHSFPSLTKTILVVLLAVYRKLSSTTRLAKLVCSVTDAPPVFLSPTSQTLFSLCCNSHKWQLILIILSLRNKKGESIITILFIIFILLLIVLIFIILRYWRFLQLS